MTPLHARRLHLRIGKALEASDAPADPRAIAHHLDLGGEPQRAVPHWIDAGAQSRQRFAHHDATALYARAISALAAAGERPTEDRLEQEVAARVGLAVSHLAVRTADDEELQDNIDRLTELVEPMRTHPEALPVWRATLLANNLAGRADRVRSMAPALLSMAEARGRPTELVDAHHSMGEASLHAGRLDDARHHFETARDALAAIRRGLTDPTDDQDLRLRDVGARLESGSAGVATLQHRHDDARRHVERSLQLTVDGLNTPLVRVGNLTICASIRWLVGDAEAAVELADRALEEADGENEDFAAIARVVQWAVRGIPPASDARAAVRTMLERPTIPFPLGLIVFFRADLLPAHEMLEWLDASESHCERVDTHWVDAEFRRHRARLVLSEGAAHDVVEQHLRHAHETATDQASAFFLADIERDRAALS